MRLRGRHYATGEPTDVLCDAGVITSVEPAAVGAADLEAGWLAPAFFDLQINGCDGRGFSSEKLTVADVRHVAEVCHRHGIAGLCPTLITNSFAALSHGFRTLRQACEADPHLNNCLLCFHLEGPYISPDDGPRGAHPRAHVRPPDWDEFRRLQESSGNRIRLVTLAPEWPEAPRFIERLTRAGVVAALGHTAATGAQVRAAVAAGARLSTHLGNGAPAVLPRHPNVIWEQLADDGLWASIICDGHHLPASVAKCMVRVKTPARIVLTCDASNLAGVPPGRYREWEQEFDVLDDGKVVVAGTGYLGGSGVFTDVCVGNAVRFAGVTLAEAVHMAGANPRRLLSLPPRSLESGQPADVVLFDWREDEPLQVRATVVRGNLVRGS
jgi:N-acetylglucosamine-6-phosphate deacetylase